MPNGFDRKLNRNHLLYYRMVTINNLASKFIVLRTRIHSMEINWKCSLAVLAPFTHAYRQTQRIVYRVYTCIASYRIEWRLQSVLSPSYELTTYTIYVCVCVYWVYNIGCHFLPPVRAHRLWLYCECLYLCVYANTNIIFGRLEWYIEKLFYSLSLKRHFNWTWTMGFLPLYTLACACGCVSECPW